jgi:predicted DNA-binding transcriptional regulator AlpA
MGKTLSDEDVEAIALRVVHIMGTRLGVIEPPAQPPPPPVPPESPKQLPQKPTFTLNELSKELGLSKASIYRLTARRLLLPLPYLRIKIYSRAEVERFLRGPSGKGF